MRDFLQFHFATHVMPAGHATFLTSQSFKDTVNKVEKDDISKAELLCELLNYLAICPLEKLNPDNFTASSLAQRALTHETVAVCIRFNRVSNFVAPFIEIPVDHPVAKKLYAKIYENLHSSYYKAAQVHRRLEKKRTARYNWIQNQAHKEYMAVLDAVIPNEQGRRFATDADYAAANAAYDRVRDPKVAHFENRFKGVIDASSHEQAQGNYWDILRNFALNHIASPEAPALLH